MSKEGFGGGVGGMSEKREESSSAPFFFGAAVGMGVSCGSTKGFLSGARSFGVATTGGGGEESLGKEFFGKGGRGEEGGFFGRYGVR